MSWNYRIIEHDASKPSYFAIHEVFYDEKNSITSWTENPIDICGESSEDVRQILKQMTQDCKIQTLEESELLKLINQK